MIVTCKSRCETGGHILNVRQPANRAIAKRLGMLFWLKSFGSGGIIWRDLLRKHDATLTNGAVKRGGGRSGGYGSVFFDGSNDVATVPAHAEFGITGDISCTCSIYKTSTNATILVKETGAVWDYAFYLLNGLPAFYADGQTPAQRMASNPVPAGWSNVAIVRASSVIYFYINGKLDSSASQTGSFNNNSVILRLGLDPLDASVKLAGYMDNVCLFNRGLTSSEVRFIHRDNRRGNPQMLNWIHDVGHISTGNRRRRFMTASA